MAANDCLPQVHACVIRVTALEADGVPLPGADNMYVSDALTKLTLKPVYTDGDEIEEKNACGTVGVNYKGDDSFKRCDVELELLTPDPYLHALLIGTGDLLEPASGGVGFAYPSIGAITGNGVSIELWAKRIDNGALDATNPYAWWALPRVTNLRLGDREFSASAQKSPIVGQALENPNWFDGPDNLWTEASDRVAQWIPTDVLPDVSCGYVALAAS